MTAKGFFTIILIDLLLPIVSLLNIYIYFYPIFYKCDFPRAPGDRDAEFRLLTIADPQIEGDSSLRRIHFRSRTPREQSLADRLDNARFNALSASRYYLKVLDLWGNDHYLAHVYRRVKSHSQPTHVAVVGDLLGSQWISDEEFERRGKRFWEIFSDGEKVTAGDIAARSADGPEWSNKLLILPGNHDVGYSGDMNPERLTRFKKMFGPYDYGLHFHPWFNTSRPTPDPLPELRIFVLNSLTLDAPVGNKLAETTLESVDMMLKNKSIDAHQATVLLTHLPFWKPEGVCTDGPTVEYFSDGESIKSQNFQSEVMSNLLKGWIFGFPSGDDYEVKGKSRGVIMNGHDHQGCDTTHWWNTTATEMAKYGHWDVATTKRWKSREMMEHIRAKEEDTRDKTESIRELTVRSIMGEYSGNVGLLSAWYEWDTAEWKFEYGSCALGVQHIWWTAHGFNVGATIWSVILGLWYLKDIVLGTKTPERKQKELEKKTN